MTLRILTRLMLAVVVLAAGRRLAAEQAYAALPLDAGHAASEPLAAPATSHVDPQVQPTGVALPLQSAVHDPWSGGVEFGFTRFSFTNASFALVDDRTGGLIRPYLGWETPKGTGIRGEFSIAAADSVATRASDATRFDIEPRASTINIDMYRRLRLHDFELVLGAGTQVASFGFTFPDGSEDRWAASGVGLFAEGRQPYYVTECSEWSVIGGGRVGYLIGEISYSNPASYDDVGLNIMAGRAYFGMEWRRRLSRGDFVFQWKSDTQIWHSDGFGNVGLDTMAFNVGANW